MHEVEKQAKERAGNFFQAQQDIIKSRSDAEKLKEIVRTLKSDASLSKEKGEKQERILTRIDEEQRKTLSNWGELVKEHEETNAIEFNKVHQRMVHVRQDAEKDF